MDHLQHIVLEPTVSLGSLIGLMVTLVTLIFALGKFWQEVKEFGKQLHEHRGEFQKHVDVDRDSFEQLHDQILRIILTPNQPLIDRMTIVERRIEAIIPVAHVTVKGGEKADKPEEEKKK